MTSSSRFLFSNGVISHSPNTSTISTFLESNPGAYTTTRTNASSLIFWERHLQRLSNSTKILLDSNPLFFFKSLKPTSNVSSLSLLLPPMWNSATFEALVNGSMREVLPEALKERSGREEFAVTTLVSGDMDKLVEIKSGERIVEALNVSVHIGTYVPPVFGEKGNGASLALVGHGRDIAEAKYSEWVRRRKHLEDFRPPSVTELLLSDDGDHILEGCLTNFFVVCQKDSNEVVVQTAPVRDGVLPGIIRQLVIEVCLSNGIPVQEVAPSWSKREVWQEAFITNSLRLVQHVEKVQVPSAWESMRSKTLNQISWEEKQFEESPGMITKYIQKKIMEKADVEGYKF
ncbi:D-aminoacid aminotransferase-like PLP-dependent enzymes superfamily protein [Euphorbia peplus]|nr:D-aminoacid aminotransferase-like PLP-dependent enzymes superfamily protein [Euphorbia peplus]